jgi:MOSC domain-containing protein YiiM
VKLLGEVLGVFSAKSGESGFPRPKKEKLILKSGYGIENDKFAGKKLNQSVMIVGTTAYKIAKEQGITLEFGSLGENIVVNFNPHKLEIGAKLKIGDSGVVQITENCTICKHLTVFDKKLPKILKSDRGIYCKIIEDGEVKIGDKISLL